MILSRILSDATGRGLVGAVILLVVLGIVYTRPPVNFPLGKVIFIEEGTTVEAAGDLLKDLGAVRSSTLFSFLVEGLGSRGVIAGEYVFNTPTDLLDMAWRFAHGGNAPLIKVVVPEGATARDIGEILSEVLPGFDEQKFDDLAIPYEGYLFPETYFFAAGTEPETIITVMRHTFDEKVATIEPQITTFGKPLQDVVIMASLLEKEARKTDTRRTVAGILWKRLSIDMPLQVDAVFGYILNRNTFSPTFSQIATDSPYNTYTNKGLPPGPIGNPGLDALMAAVTPIETKYLYYLTGSDGVMYYAKTFAGHVANRKHLK